MTEQKLLIADDDRLIRVTLKKGLTQAGYTVYEASTGEEAMEICEQHTPDLAIMDIQMPGINGIEAAGELYKRSGTPFMIFSAYGDDELVKEATDKGALGYLVKPLQVEQIIPAVETALKRAKEIRALQLAESNLQSALSSNRNTSIAVGLIMERFKLEPDAAFNLLRDNARSQRRKLNEVADEMVKAAEILNIHKY